MDYNFISVLFVAEYNCGLITSFVLKVSTIPKAYVMISE